MAGTKGEGSAAPAPAAAGGGGSGGSSRPLKREAAGAPASQDAGAAQQPPAPASKRLRTDAPSAVDPAPAKVGVESVDPRPGCARQHAGLSSDSCLPACHIMQLTRWSHAVIGRAVQACMRGLQRPGATAGIMRVSQCHPAGRSSITNLAMR
jgi:hypothetical protein